MGSEVVEMDRENALAVFDPEKSWSREYIELVKRTICKDATDDELMLFEAICRRTRLDPFKKQIYAVKRYDSRENRKVMQAQVSIDGLRLIAQRSGEYIGQDGPEWCGDDGVWRDVWLSPSPPAAARVGVLRSGFAQPVYAVALWGEYVQTTNDGAVTSMWKRFASVMLAKCAEALALRKAFPDEASGVHTMEEMAQVGGEIQEPTDTALPSSPVDEAKHAIALARDVFGEEQANQGIAALLGSHFGGKKFADLSDAEYEALAAAIRELVEEREAVEDAEFDEIPETLPGGEARRFPVEGSRGAAYVISVYDDGGWECSCPARVDDCKHVKQLRRPFVADDSNDGAKAGWLWPGDAGYDNAPPSDTAVAEKVERTLAREVEPKPEHPLREDDDGPQSEGAVVAELVEHGKALGLTEEEVMLTIARAGRGVAENLTKPHVKLSAKGAIGIAAREKKGEVITGD